MEWPIRKEFLGKLWKGLEPVDAAATQDGAPAGRYLSRPLVHVSVLLVLSLLYHLIGFGTKARDFDDR